MSVERPTYSESWHRVAGARCRLRTGVRVVRQRYRGQTWHLAQDSSANQFFRMNEPAYGFVGLLDGERTVAEAWGIASARLGDEAPTQGEVIQLLGQMYSSNLLSGEVPGDARAVFRRHSKRVARELRGHLTNLLFLRIPLLDPDAFLTRWEPLVRWMFTRVGLVVWVVILCAGLFHLAGRERQLVSAAAGVLSADNLFLLYVSFAFIKLVHEFAHGFCCKSFGVREGGDRAGAGEVHAMGIMLMVLMPVPYVDASSAWALRSRTRRAVVAGAGMMAEFAIASVAAIVWAHSSDGSTVHAVAYNAMFAASVSTLIFNGNPLMRYDGYHILSEMLEIPNLAQRSNDYCRYLIKKYVWGVRNVVDPSSSGGERAWLLVYGPASMVYRLIVFAGIILFISQKWFIVGALFAIFGVVTWFALPVGRFVRYLAGSPELARVRGRAVTTSVLAAVVVLIAVGAVPAPDRVRVEGVVEPVGLALVHARSDGFLVRMLDSGEPVGAASTELAREENPSLTARRLGLLTEVRRLQIARRQALESEVALAQQYDRQIQALTDELRFADEDVDGLSVRSDQAGTWVSPQSDAIVGAYAKRGTQLGMVADLTRLMVRATATQDAAAMLLEHRPASAEIRVKGRPEQAMNATVGSILPAGQEQLPSRALGFDAGGPLQMDPRDQRNGKTLEPFFELRLMLEANTALLPGQRVIARFRLPDRPLALQAWDALSRTLQRRFRV